MIEIGKPPREDAVAQELRAMEDRKKEESPNMNKGISPHWVVLGFVAVLILAILLL